MRKGFIFNHNRCVNCNTCSAACLLENGWVIHPRNIYSVSPHISSDFPLIHLSLACNHCETAACMNGCPVSAYERDPQTGAVIINDQKCIGCKYCEWNCPYDAPKYNQTTRLIGKCNLCYSLLSEGFSPACTSACPTGALNYGEIPDTFSQEIFTWFPDANLNPSVSFTDDKSKKALKIIPENTFVTYKDDSIDKERSAIGDWSLIAFSFLTILSVSLVLSSLVKGVFPDKITLIPSIISAGIVSLFHLGKRFRAWRSLANIKRSPLSREIALFLLFSFMSFATLFLKLPLGAVVTSLVGLILLLAIDSVYLFSDKNRTVILHSGQCFISGLIITSYLSGYLFPFLFIAVIKIFSIGYAFYRNNQNSNYFGLRFLRLIILIIAGISFVTRISYPDSFMLFLFLFGELIDRVLFYYDFTPLNINSEIKKYNNHKHEK